MRAFPYKPRCCRNKGAISFSPNFTMISKLVFEILLSLFQAPGQWGRSGDEWDQRRAPARPRSSSARFFDSVFPLTERLEEAKFSTALLSLRNLTSPKWDFELWCQIPSPRAGQMPGIKAISTIHTQKAIKRPAGPVLAGTRSPRPPFVILKTYLRLFHWALGTTNPGPLVRCAFQTRH